MAGATGGDAPTDGGARSTGSGGGDSSKGGDSSEGGDNRADTAGGTPVGGGANMTASSSYEAEDAFNGGSATFATDVTGFSGVGYVDGLTAVRASVIFTVNIASDGTAKATLHYRNAGATRSIALLVNGNKVSDVDFGSTAAAGFASRVDTLSLRTGLNTIAYVAETSGGQLSLDRLEIDGGAPRNARGASVPFTEYEAEAAQTNGVKVGPDRTYGTLAAEASGRRAVRLDAPGQFIEWSTVAPANALTLRYSLPDAVDGGGRAGSISLYVDGNKRQSLALSSKYAWVYGAYPYNNDPSTGSPHRYFDETCFLVGDIPAGAKLRLAREAGDAAVTVDLLDAELAPAAYAKPAGALSIVDRGATADDDTDDTAAISAAIGEAKAQRQVLWIPSGSFLLTRRLDVDHVTIRGAGPWYSVLRGSNGKGGFNGTGDDIKLLDFAVFGDVTYRDDQNFDPGINGVLGKGSLIQNLWFEHTKVGLWLVAPTDGAYIAGCRIHDTFADGINFATGTKHSAAEQVHVRNTGDDAFAIWANAAGTDGNRFKFDTARSPILANAFAIYGGSDNSIEDSDGADTVYASAGVAISTRFTPTPFSGTTSLLRTTLTRTGGYEPTFQRDIGGLWLLGDASAIAAPITIHDLLLVDSTYQGIVVSSEKSVSGLLFDGVTISGAGTQGIEVASAGSGTFTSVAISGTGAQPTQISARFKATLGAGNSGW